MRFAAIAAAAVLLGACGSSHEKAVTSLPHSTTAPATKPTTPAKSAPTTLPTALSTGQLMPVKIPAAQLAQLQAQLAQLSGDLTGASTDIAGADVNAAKSQEGSAP
jgi:hypothetical protein